MSVKREREKRAFQLILESGEEGILQIEMRRILGADTREGSVIALKFLKGGIIKRLKELHESRWTYRLISTRKPITVESIIDCPCMACNDIERCIPGLLVSPFLCKKLTYWLDINTDNEFASSEEEFHEDKM